jgi:hypothetical protein
MRFFQFSIFDFDRGDPLGVLLPPPPRKRGSIHGKINQQQGTRPRPHAACRPARLKFTRSAEQYSEAVRGWRLALLPTLVQSPVGEMRNSSTSGRRRRCSASVSPFLRSLLRITIRYSNCLPPSVKREDRFATENPCL